MILFDGLMTESALKALGWTLMHSLWQGTAIALALSLILRTFRRLSSNARYVLGLMALALVLIVSLSTFFGQYQAIQQERMTLNDASRQPTTSAQISQSNSPPGRTVVSKDGGLFSQLLSPFKKFTERHLTLIVAAWFLGLLFCMARFAAGFVETQKLKRHVSNSHSRIWQNRCDRLSVRLDLKKPVRMLASGLVSIPVAIGYFKPVLLFPLGVLSGQPLDQVEALILHELAHIRRRDYLLNIIQSLIEMVFFYHPAAKWISSFIRAEREKCCDDIVLRSSNAPASYAKALAGLVEDARGGSNVVMAVSREKTGLLDRIKRIFNHSQVRSSSAEGFAAVCILVFCLLLVVTVSASGLARSDAEANQTLTPEELIANLRTKVFTGGPISLEFHNADLATVLGFIETQSGFEFRREGEIRGKVSLEISRLPWDQVLDYLLDVNSLGLVRRDDQLLIRRLSPAEIAKRDERNREIQNRRGYSGKRTDLDFRDTDLVDILLFLAREYDLNVLIDPGVPIKRKITVRFLNTEWDKALNSVLKANRLEMQFNGNLLRVKNRPNQER